MKDPVKYEKFDEENTSQTIDYSQKVINLESEKTVEISVNPLENIEEQAKQEITNAIKQHTIKKTTNIISSAKEKLSTSILNKFNNKIEFIRKYFDVDLEDIKLKLKASIFPLNKDFQPLAEQKPDLYGPFWIYATLVFIIAVAGNMSGYLNWKETIPFKYNFEFVPSSAGYIYGFGFGSPIILGLIMKYLGIEIKLVLVICYYGYSFTVMGPMLILCVAPLNLLKWIFLLYAISSSTIFVLFNLWKDLLIVQKNSRYFLVGSIVVCQLILLFALKYHFFAVIS